ncbi:MAG: helix-hairpin-helix domain-containing protein [Oscillibacter sp.]|nr:helix-hairpin-helix domain-containing protein [Oscillibacter sp.]MCI9114513.1 helix-hairpin-helix domain-containing protein [Oscillibacter sp.]MCI9299901.1 helix-hairpin-helix domain-containing protein [Oscillibacter sp.]MCI9461592.1 helix-hairpin-helix domain-containing protein [Oscillibacter sp.]
MISPTVYQKKRRNATMETRRNAAWGEGALLGLTGLFLCLLLGLFLRDRAAMEAPASVETALTAPVEEVRPDLSPVNLNTADEAALTALPGIGEALAARIVEYREEHGPFEAVEDLTNVSGIGQGKLAALEGLVTVEDSE